MFLLALAMLPAGALACLQALSNYRQLSALAEESVLQAAVLSAQDEENVVITAGRLLQTLSVIPAIVHRQPGDCGETLAAVLSTSNLYGSAAVVDGRGEIVCAHPASAQGLDVSAAPWYRAVVDRGSFTVTGNARDIASDTIVLAASLPLFDSERNIDGALFLAILPQWMSELLSETDTPDVAQIALVDRWGTIVAEHSGGSDASPWLPDPSFLSAYLSDRPRSFRTDGVGAYDGIFATAPLLRDELYVVVGSAPGHPAAVSVWRIAGAIGFPVVMWLIALAVAWFALDRLVIQPILRLRRAAAAFTAGKKGERASGLSEMPEEIGELGRTLNAMADSLAVQESDLRVSLNEQKSLLKELHHRVKNNLQVIASLLNLQIHRATEPREKLALRMTQHRIYALAKVHDALNYAAGDNLVALDETLTPIADYLARAGGPRGGSVRIHFDIDRVRTASKRAVPIALLLTEAVSTALRASRPEDGPENLWVSVKRMDTNGARLTIASDCPTANGAGSDSNTLSTKLVAGFVKQLGAQSRMDTESGYRLSVIIPDVQ